MKTVKFVCNIGTRDQKRLALTEAYQDGAIVDMDDAKADQVVKEGMATLYDAKAKADDEAKAKAAHEAAVAAAIPEAKANLAKEAAKADAEKLAKHPVPVHHKEPPKEALKDK